ncbi:MAG TPA: hypothetical protein VME66_09885 [Candidatus Acidoferrales bacterium]|nr:hypothetical protein [Candidatus Acidoferrales bacterium]
MMLGSIVGGPIHLVPLTPNTGERLILVFNTNALRDNAAPLNLILPHVSDGVQIPGTVCVITPNTSGHFVSLTDEQCRRGIALLSEFAQP